jgi:hypothetical protein
MIRFVLAIVAGLILGSGAKAQVSLPFPGPGKPASTSAVYQGPGDISVGGSTGGWSIFWSSARAYNTAYANGTNPMVDLVDASTGTVAVCTLRVATTGYVDLSAYCPGSLTPDAACAAAAGGSCKTNKVYDQSGLGRHLTQATLANMPSVTFNAISGLPALTCSGTCFLATSATLSVGQPITMWSVHNLTAGATEAMIIGAAAAAVGTGIAVAANTATVNAGTASTATETNGVWHAHGALLNGTGNNCALHIDTTDTAGLACGTNAFTAQAVRIFRGNAFQAVGSATEGGIVARAANLADRQNIQINAKSATVGYGAGLP